jgi:glycolate oxidase FAD binding subunit
VQAGVTLVDLNRELMREGQWLPLDTAFDGATIGGLLATNDAGPLRHRYGTPRDLLIGITLALTDGRLVRSGGHVVKNVAGYDLGKLVTGSFGTLAAVVDATFKLSPRLSASRTLVLPYVDFGVLATDVVALSSSQLEPAAFDLHVLVGPAGRASHPARLLVRFATSPEATRSQVDAAAGLLKGDAGVLSDAAEAALWNEQVRRPWTGPGTVVRLGWLPAALPQVLELADDLQRTTGGTIELTARAAVGAGFLRIDADERHVRTAVDRLRSNGRVVSNVVVLRAPAGMVERLDVWGPSGTTAPLLRALKQTFDPAGILNAGRGPI